jgi:hypothetical protein
MFTPRSHENRFLFLLRWFARASSAIGIAFLLLFMFGNGLDLTHASWQEKGIILLFPIGLLSGLILGWQEETLGGALAIFSVWTFYVIYRTYLNDSGNPDWWIVLFSIPGFLFMLHGLLSSNRRTKVIDEI